MREITTVLAESSDFGDILTSFPAASFFAAGFAYGDACDVLFDGVTTFKDVPFYSGYYGRKDTLVVTDSGTERVVKVAYCGGKPTLPATGSRIGASVTIVLKEKGKYQAVEQSLRLVYSCRREDYGSDEVFSNFRPVNGGRLRKDRLYRGASPCDDRFGRAVYSDRLIGRAGIRTVVDLADREDQIRQHLERSPQASPCFRELLERGRVIPCGLFVDYCSAAYARQAADGLSRMAQMPGPFFLHCTEGKDRTGFICLVLELLCGCSKEEIEKDYLKSYENYYGFNAEKDPERVAAVKERILQDMWDALLSEEETDPVQAAARYLAAGGLSAADRRRLRNRLCLLSDPAAVRPFLDGEGRVTAFPAKRKKQLAVLSYLSDRLDPDREYSERELNGLLNRWHTFGDPATLRRELYDFGLVDREKDGSRYRLDPDRLSAEELVERFC